MTNDCFAFDYVLKGVGLSLRRSKSIVGRKTRELLSSNLCEASPRLRTRTGTRTARSTAAPGTCTAVGSPQRRKQGVEMPKVGGVGMGAKPTKAAA